MYDYVTIILIYDSNNAHPEGKWPILALKIPKGQVGLPTMMSSPLESRFTIA